MNPDKKKVIDNEIKSRYNEQLEKIYPEPQFEDLPCSDDEIED
jgi:hypothetical protein